MIDERHHCDIIGCPWRGQLVAQRRPSWEHCSPLTAMWKYAVRYCSNSDGGWRGIKWPNPPRSLSASSAAHSRSRSCCPRCCSRRRCRSRCPDDSFSCRRRYRCRAMANSSALCSPSARTVDYCSADSRRGLTFVWLDVAHGEAAARPRSTMAPLGGSCGAGYSGSRSHSRLSRSRRREDPEVDLLARSWSSLAAAMSRAAVCCLTLLSEEDRCNVQNDFSLINACTCFCLWIMRFDKII